MPTDNVFKAISDPTRRKILRLLNGGEMTAGQISEHFDISAPSMSHHFGVLKNADLVNVRRAGQQLYYSINTSVFEDVMTVLLELFGTGKPPETPKEGDRK